MTISIFENLNSSNAMFHQDGLKIYEVVKGALDKGENTIVVDFSNINVLTTQFMNASFGKLIIESGIPFFNKHIKTSGTEKLSTYQTKLDWVIDNIQNNDNYKSLLDIALS